MSRWVGSVSRRLLADEALELGGQPVDLGDVRLLAGEQVLRLGEVGQPERRRAAPRPSPRVLELGLHLRAAAQPAVDLDVAQLGLQPIAAAEPQGDRREDQADDGDDRARRPCTSDARIGDPERLGQHERRRRRRAGR